MDLSLIVTKEEYNYCRGPQNDYQRDDAMWLKDDDLAVYTTATRLCPHNEGREEVWNAGGNVLELEGRQATITIKIGLA
jgi:hypothetical protein